MHTWYTITMKRRSKVKKDFPLLYNYLVGTMYLFILLTAVLGIALILQSFFDQQSMIFYPERSPIQEGAPIATDAEPIFLLQIFSAIITIIMVAVSIFVIVTLPLLIGSPANWIVHKILDIMNVAATWRSLLISKAVLFLSSFVFLTLAVIITNYAVGYYLLQLGGGATLAAALLLTIQLFMQQSIHKKFAKAW